MKQSGATKERPERELSGRRASRRHHRDRGLTLRPLANPKCKREALTFELKNQRLLAMTEHKFKIGQVVYFHPKKSKLPSHAPSGPYQINAEGFSEFQRGCQP